MLWQKIPPQTLINRGVFSIAAILMELIAQQCAAVKRSVATMLNIIDQLI
jgi:hypothetical protein